MFDEILNVASRSEYDFLQTACPDDPRKHLFPEWLDYYREQWAIAHLLQPHSILDLGVGYGYSGSAFLSASPQSTYLGLARNCDESGETPALSWARKVTSPFTAQFVTTTSNQLDRFPGDIYDLIHLDGEAHADTLWHDLELALRQGRWLLISRCHAERSFLAISYFLHRHRDLIRSYSVSQGGMCQLLVQVSPAHLQDSTSTTKEAHSLDLQDVYTDDYYLQDCGGFEHYKQNAGKSLEDERLQVVAAAAALHSPRRVLDLGCGRGELAYYFASQGCRVTAADYSAEAIRLCERTFEGAGELRKRVELLCANVCEMPLRGVFDAVTASDVIEHLSPSELEKLYANVSRHLAQNGLFVLHTYPNLWYLRYEYARKRRIAESVGAYLPPQPRTRYEMLMHINEQSPRILKRSLQRHFKHVLLWFGEPGRPVRSLLEPLSHRDLASSRDLYAIASHAPIDMARLASQFFSDPLPLDGLDQIQIEPSSSIRTVQASSEFTAALQLSNRSPQTISSNQPAPVLISYHWLNASGSVCVFDGKRTSIKPALPPNSERRLLARIKAPDQPGEYLLRLTLVQELVRWFDSAPLHVYSDIPITVTPSLPSAGAVP